MGTLTEEPTNGLGHFGCGLCPTWFQVLAPVFDENQQPILDEQGQPVYVFDQEASAPDMYSHAAEAHSDPIVETAIDSSILTND